jgi:hypothetical protein
MGTISEMDERLFELKIVKRTDVKEITSFTSLQEGKIVCSELLINIIYVKKYTGYIKQKQLVFNIK